MIFADLVKRYETEEHEAKEVVQLFSDYFESAMDKETIELGIQFFINKAERLSEKKILSKEEWLFLLELIRITLMKKIIFNGELPSTNWCELYGVLILQKIEFSQDETLLFFRGHFYNQFLAFSAEQNEKYIYNALIFLLDLLSIPTEEALELFLERSICIDATYYIDFKEANFFGDFLTKNFIDINVLFKSVKKILKVDYFFTLDKGQQRSVFVWLLNVVWPIARYFNNSQWLELYSPIKKLIQNTIKYEAMTTQMYLHFFLYHICGNNYQTQDEWKVFNEEIEKPASQFYASYAKKSNLPLCKSKGTESGKIKIAVVRDRIVENSPYKVEYSLFATLMSNKAFVEKYQLYYVSMGYIDKAIDQPEFIEKIERLGIEYVAPGNSTHFKEGFYDHFEKAILIRQWFLDNSIDILVGTVSGYDIMNFLFSTRSAPLQVFWSHGNYQYDIDGIDNKIFHYSEENKIIDLYGHKYRSFKIPHKLETFNEAVDLNAILDERAQYPNDSVVLGTIGRLVKVDSEEYITTICEIMKKHTKTIYIAAGVGNTNSIKAKILPELLERFYFPGFVNPHLYSHVIDIYLDTFPLRQGTSFTEFHIKDGGKAAILMDFDTGSGNMWSDWFKQFTNNEKLIPAASTYQEYIQKASDVIENKTLRKEVGQMLYHSTEIFLSCKNNLDFIDAVLSN